MAVNSPGKVEQYPVCGRRSPKRGVQPGKKHEFWGQTPLTLAEMLKLSERLVSRQYDCPFPASSHG